MAVFNLLICTVGGSPEPLVKSLLEWRPARVLFVPSAQTRAQVDAVLRAYAEHAGAPLRPGEYEICPVSNAEGLEECLDVIRRYDQEVVRWTSRGSDYHVVADFTAGTKCMTAALVLQARRWSCRYSYVGGASRSKEGVGVVESGSERVVHWANPWEALGYQAVEDACLLFDQQAFLPAARLLDAARKATDDGAVKRSLSTFHQLCEGYGLWDRFQHKDAAQRIDSVLKNAADIQVMLPTGFDGVIGAIKRNQETLRQLVCQSQSRAMVSDLLANAGRRKREARYDDGVARLYRAIEALAQLALAERHGIQGTDNVPLESVPEPLRERWGSRADAGKLWLGLQDAFELLDALGDDIGKTFKAPDTLP
ncbi:MAG TPA: TIGR02710 family CRISPR-associated CARF protein [Bradyrhizobium sp.]|nr:TIGR02710 family CRISPR-associated CARF protein [Bradyrhizobium sp.]